nr:aspartate-rich protein 1-like [Macaca nemestrina]
MGCILTCCIDSRCRWCRGKVAPSYESDTYEAVAAATSESTTIEPGKLDVGATEGHDLQHISNQKMPTGWIEEPWLWVFPARAVTVSSSLVLIPELSPGENMLGPMGIVVNSSLG